MAPAPGLRWQEDALFGVASRSEAIGRIGVRDVRKDAQRSLTAELETAEKTFRARARQIAEQLPEAAKTAEKTPADSPPAQAATRISRTVRHGNPSMLGPYWMLIVLCWLIGTQHVGAEAGGKVNIQFPVAHVIGVPGAV